MMSSRTRTRLSTWAGLWGAALAWAVNMQLGQILPAIDCTRQAHISAFVSAALAVLALLAGYVSWRSSRRTPENFGAPETLRFDATLSALSSLIFAFALVLQLAASWMLTGCER